MTKSLISFVILALTAIPAIGLANEFSGSKGHQQDIEPTPNQSLEKPKRTLWGFRCISPETKTVMTVAIKNREVTSITVLPLVDGQINQSRSTVLKRVSRNLFAGEFKPLVIEDEGEETVAVTPKIQYEMTFQLAEANILDNSSSSIASNGTQTAPKIEEALLKENGLPTVGLDCTAVYQTRQVPAIYQ